MRLNENYTFEGAADRCGQDLASFRCVSVYRRPRTGSKKFPLGTIEMFLDAHQYEDYGELHSTVSIKTKDDCSNVEVHRPMFSDMLQLTHVNRHVWV
ncbi:hypothetical protein TNCV_812821 [Trichonephila clavipes]|nr:hypothetical protein TNCV_812821 [Trichonephila clavipes]